MNKATVIRIRPMSWKLWVQGREEVECVRGVLSGTQLECTGCTREPDLVDPPVFSFIASPKVVSPLTSAELQAILENDDRIEVAFDATERTK